MFERSPNQAVILDGLVKQSNLQIHAQYDFSVLKKTKRSGQDLKAIITRHVIPFSSTIVVTSCHWAILVCPFGACGSWRVLACEMTCWGASEGLTNQSWIPFINKHSVTFSIYGKRMPHICQHSYDLISCALMSHEKLRFRRWRPWPSWTSTLLETLEHQVGQSGGLVPDNKFSMKWGCRNMQKHAKTAWLIETINLFSVKFNSTFYKHKGSHGNNPTLRRPGTNSESPLQPCLQQRAWDESQTPQHPVSHRKVSWQKKAMKRSELWQLCYIWA